MNSTHTLHIDINMDFWVCEEVNNTLKVRTDFIKYKTPDVEIKDFYTEQPEQNLIFSMVYKDMLIYFVTSFVDIANAIIELKNDKTSVSKMVECEVIINNC